jgi:hypothetical protein
MAMEWVRRNYGVPSRRGGKVEYSPDDTPVAGTITGTKGPYLRVRLEGAPRPVSLHPTWRLRYL